MIYKYDFRYSIVKLFVDAALRLNFKKLIVTGKENIPHDLPVVFTPNHRNALIDALLVVYANKQRRQVVFLARGDIFKKPFIAWILRGMRLIPVFRIRDGKESLDKNGEIFDVAGKVLKNNNPLALFPEAAHNPKQSLLPLQKAVPRIVLPVEAQHDFRLNSQIVPVSIYYTDLTGFLRDCFVHFGKPIPVAAYREMYAENPNLSINKLRSDLEIKLREMVVDIWNDEYYEMYKSYIDWNREEISIREYPDEKDAEVKAAQQIVKTIDHLYENDPAEFERKKSDFEEATKISKDHDLRSTDKLLKPESTFRLILKYLLLTITFPVALFGFINGVFPILFYKRLLKLFEDKQFTATVRYVVGLAFVPAFDVIQTLLAKAIFHDWNIALAYFAAMPLSFLFAVHWRRKAKSVNRQWRVNRFVKHFPKTWDKLVKLIAIPPREMP